MNFGGVEENVATREEFPLAKATMALTLSLDNVHLRSLGTKQSLMDSFQVKLYFLSKKHVKKEQSFSIYYLMLRKFQCGKQ